MSVVYFQFFLFLTLYSALSHFDAVVCITAKNFLWPKVHILSLYHKLTTIINVS